MTEDDLLEIEERVKKALEQEGLSLPWTAEAKSVYHPPYWWVDSPYAVIASDLDEETAKPRLNLPLILLTA